MSNILGTIRASSWSDFFDCSYRWYWKYIEGLRLPSGAFAVVGTALHKGTAVYDTATLGGAEPAPAERLKLIEASTEAAAQYVRDPVTPEGKPQEVDWSQDDDLGKGSVLDFAVKLTAKYCLDVAPDMLYTAVEVECKKLDVTTDSGIVRLTGTTDRVRKFRNGTKGIGDFKSGGKAVVGITSPEGPRAETKGHQLQLGAYTLMTEQETGQKLDGPATIVGFQTNSKLHVAEGVIENPKRALVGTPTQKGMIEIAAAALKAGVFPPNPKSMLCSKKWCPAWDRCIYHE